MARPQSVGLIVTCPHCKETVEILVTKRQIRQIYKTFKLPIRQAQLKGEASLDG